MAQTITAPLYGHFIAGPGMVMPLADQTGTTAVQQFIGTGGRAIGVNWITALISMKTFVVGTSTAYPIFCLDLADNLAFTTNRRRVASVQPLLGEAIAAVPATNPIASMLLQGFSPDAAKNFWRITALVPAGTGTFTYDVIVAGT